MLLWFSLTGDIYLHRKLFSNHIKQIGQHLPVCKPVIDCPYIGDGSNRTRRICKIFTHKHSILIPTDLKLDLRVQAQTWHSKWPSLTFCCQFNSKLMKNWLLQVRQIPNMYGKVSMEYLCTNLITLCTYVHHKNNVCGKEYANELWPSDQSN